MNGTVLLSARIPAELVKRADRLVKAVSKDPQISNVGRVTRTTVIKLALARGLEALEADYA